MGYVSRFIYIALDVAEALLVVRFAFRLLGADPVNEFVAWVYRASEPLVAPFQGAFPTTATNGSVADWPALTAMILYALFVFLTIRVLGLASPGDRRESQPRNVT